MKASVTLTDSQIKALPTTMIEVVPAPGNNKVIIPYIAIWQNNIVVVYDNIDPGGYAVFSDPLNDLEIGQYFMGSTVGAFLNNGLTLGHGLGTDVISNVVVAEEITSFIGEPLCFYVDNSAAGDFTGGDAANTMKITVYYIILDL